MSGVRRSQSLGGLADAELRSWPPPPPGHGPSARRKRRRSSRPEMGSREGHLTTGGPRHRSEWQGERGEAPSSPGGPWRGAMMPREENIARAKHHFSRRDTSRHWVWEAELSVTTGMWREWVSTPRRPQFSSGRAAFIRFVLISVVTNLRCLFTGDRRGAGLSSGCTELPHQRCNRRRLER